VAVLRGVDLQVRRGEMVAIVAPPGAGLTTLLLCAAGLLRPDAGSVHWGSAPGTRAPSGALAPGVSLLLGAPFPTVREATSTGAPAWYGRRAASGAGCGGPLLLGGPLARWRAGDESADELAAALGSLARGGAAVLVARRRHDAVCERADRVLALSDGRCTRFSGAGTRVDPPSEPP
jgi:ABC-type branched-subunit amino acid transport system ATPase component